MFHPSLALGMPEGIQESQALKGQFIGKCRSQDQRSVNKSSTEAEQTKHFQSNFCPCEGFPCKPELLLSPETSCGFLGLMGLL